ncbi:beta-lactoglobulin-3-like [Erinaceus europaeus]|uniref:Beta-lactoglobulin-3-like n=1 Tax=Erinaceus europaeus TaxID=9365 RepID=A0ABM3Y1N0_ERIEU|nr:beta-lactoglobulin-3-like [Erinaceus europaeus]
MVGVCLRAPDSPFPLTRENDKCVEKKIVAEKTAVPAEFKIKSSLLRKQSLPPVSPPDNDEELLFFLVNTDKSDEYPIVCIKSAQGAPQKKLVCQELAKTLTFNKEAMEKFSNFAKTADAQVILFFIPGQVDEPCRF